jgi:hypothetical protein
VNPQFRLSALQEKNYAFFNTYIPTAHSESSFLIFIIFSEALSLQQKETIVFIFIFRHVSSVSFSRINSWTFDDLIKIGSLLSLCGFNVYLHTYIHTTHALSPPPGTVDKAICGTVLTHKKKKSFLLEEVAEVSQILLRDAHVFLLLRVALRNTVDVDRW